MKSFLDYKRREDGFTLIEILVVILIIGILAAIAIPVFLNQRKTAADAAVSSDAKNVITAIQTLVTQKQGQTFPITANDIRTVLAPPGVSGGGAIAVSGNSNDWCVLATNTRANLNTWDEPKKFLYYNSRLGGWQDNAVMWHSTSCATSTGVNWSHLYG